MALRRQSASPSVKDDSNVNAASISRSRRVLAAFGLGAAISVAGLAALAANHALAHGPFTAANPTSFAAPAPERDQAYQPTYSVVHFDSRATARVEEDSSRGRRHRERITAIGGRSDISSARRFKYVGHQPVCVRLCDGFFFPLPVAAYDSASQSSACNSLCPDAPTEVFYRNGSDKIEDSVSSKGQPYTALPVSLRYRGTSDNTCSCHRDAVAYAPLRDSTLRRGDAVMTPAGFIVFRGVEGVAHAAGDFTALAKAGLSTAKRGALQALERVSLAPVHPTLQTWMVSQAAPARKPAEPRGVAGAAYPDDKIRLLVWRGAQD